ncbi:Protein Y55F3C.10, partial [Aphelenchoides avenae]
MTVVFELLYIPCFCVIIRPEYIKHSCFKFMAVLGFLDITLLPFSGFLSGLYAIRGDMYCSYPAFIYSYSVVRFGAACLILAVNRCTIILNPPLAKRLFDGRRTFVWLLIAASAAIAMLFFQPLIYNGVVFAWVANPHIGYLQDDGSKYHNHLHIVTNLSAAIGLPIVYAAFVVILLWKTGGIQTLTKHREFSTFAQVLYIAGLTMTVGVTYVYFQFFTAPPIVIVLANLGWLCIQ